MTCNEKEKNRKREKENPRKTSEENEKQLLTTNRLMPSQFPSSGRAPANSSPSLYAEQDVLWYGIALWPVGVSCPGCAPSHFFCTSRAWEAEKSLTTVNTT